MSFFTTLTNALYVLSKDIDLFALLFAVLVPFLIIYVNHETRFRRLRMIDDYDNSFRTQLSNVHQKDGENNETGNPTFEYVKSKYISDIRDEEITRRAGSTDGKWPTSEKIQDLLTAPPSFFRLTANRRLMFAAVCFALITYFGFAVSFEQISCFVSTGACAGPLQNLIFVGGIGVPSADKLRFGEQVLTVAALAFLGAYIATIRELLRRMAVFDLSSFTFLKQAAETMASVLGVVFLYRALPDPLAEIATIVANQPWQVPDRIPLIWLAMAPLLGLFPESATKYLFIRFRQYFQWIKSEDGRFTEVTMITPLDVIDGIDYWTRIRLEQSGIADVQSLATYNPIMLFIETPYGIYQVFDWTAQAQLCHIVGVEKFLIFREMNVRTIFDLERAVLSTASPEQYDRIYGGILLAPTAAVKRTSAIAGTNFILPGTDPTKLTGIGEYCQWAYGTLDVHDKNMTLAIEHMIRWITDDLHVRRLRRLWIEISKSLGPESEMLPDGKPLPAEWVAQPLVKAAATPEDSNIGKDKEAGVVPDIQPVAVENETPVDPLDVVKAEDVVKAGGPARK